MPPAASAGAGPHGWVPVLGQQFVDAAAYLRELPPSSSPPAGVLDESHHTERETVEHAERARQ